MKVLRTEPVAAAWTDSAMWPSHGTVTDCCTEEQKTKGCQNAKSDPTT